ncbi:MAG: bifunctional demethylmenaquinone methyltransferase/2-methoxy-6-polyprenyl-1,4-benzoquinol methylase [Legionellales bacterium RIFCSPHIGHO2_12_FULL_37_14]|nr:MAG: bifunctional demethylmenaquinone methyltransferase/2-methoxy-6-polyprenyl-1,4-benzoquinol methylase [Legionellales bacterium RIFCSPHIGHO2_12_FULL_37_14]
MQNSEKVNFGYESVTKDEKTKRVGAVFDSVATRYDLMNNLMSFGIHHLWKKLTIELAHVRPKQVILDLASGTGDLAIKLAEKVGNTGHVIAADINKSMLKIGRARLIDKGFLNQVTYVEANAEALPLESNTVDMIFMAFGLRNVTDKVKALSSMFRVCKPGGKLIILEFTNPQNPLVKSIYDWYSFKVLPLLGKFVADDEASYKYLAESIRVHPTPEVLKNMIENAGFEDCTYTLWTQGVVAMHVAYKY